MENPKISVIMSVYNGADFLRETIDSVLSQSYGNFEFLITDNASTDDTVCIIKSYNDNRIKLTMNNTNKGYVANLNTMIKGATGKYIVRQDADDIIRKNKFKKLVDFMEKHSSVGACGYYVNVFGSVKGKIRQELENTKIRAAMLFENQIDSLAIFRTVLFKEGNIRFEEDFIPTEDYKYWFEAMKSSELANIPYFLLDYRVHGTNTSIEKKELGDRNRLRVQMEIFEYLFNQKMSDEIRNVFNILYSLDNCSKDMFPEYITCLEKIASFAKDGKEIDEETFLYYLARRWFVFCFHNKIFMFFKPNFIALRHFIKFIFSLLRKKI